MNNVRSETKDKVDNRIILVMLASFLYGIYAMSGIHHLNTIATALLILVLLFLPADNDIYVYAALIPFYQFVPQESPMRVYFLFLISIIKIFIQKGSNIDKRYYTYFMIWMVIEICMDLIYAPQFDYTILLLMVYFPIYMAKCRNMDRSAGKNVMIILIFSFAVAIIFTALSSQTSLSYYLQTTNEEVRFGEDARNLGGAMDLPIYCAVTIAFLLTSFISDRHLKSLQKIAYIGLICVCLVFGSLTVSRSFIVSILAIVIWTYISLLHNSNHRRNLITITILGIVVVVILFWKSRDVFENILFKYSQRSFFDNSRSIIYSDCFDFLLEHPVNLLFGMGAWGYHSVGIKQNLAFQMFAHNLLLDAVMSWGIVGTTAFGAMIYSFYHGMRVSYGKSAMISFLPLVTWGTFMMLGGTFNYVEPYLYLLVLIKMIFYFK